MKKNNAIMLLFVAVATMSFLACSREKELLERMEYIKEMGNIDPQRAMLMLDSLDWNTSRESEYAANKWRLLKIRLNDKAFVVATSDLAIKPLVGYFDEHGTGLDRQEVYYYAGSVYRDLQDTPRALENFLKSTEIAHSIGNCDSLMLRNAYSNLHWLYHGVQDYQNALKAAQDEYRVSVELGVLNAVVLNHVGVGLYKTDELDEAAKYFRKSLRMVETDDMMRSQETISVLLFHFSQLKMRQEAERCYELLRATAQPAFLAGQELALGDYYRVFGNPDSAIVHYKAALQVEDDLSMQSDAAKMLFQIYNSQGRNEQALQYAEQHIAVNDQLDYGLRQEMAATVNNQYKYHRNLREEERNKAEKEIYRLWLLIVALGAALLTVGLLANIYYRKSRTQKVLLEKNKELESLNAKIAAIDSELAEARQRIAAGKHELKQMSEKMAKKELLLQQKTKSTMDIEMSELIEKIGNANYGKVTLTDTDWEQIYHLVDTKHPDFAAQLASGKKTLTEKQIKAYYLMCIEQSYAVIGRIINEPRSTVYRWRQALNFPIPKIVGMEYGDEEMETE